KRDADQPRRPGRGRPTAAGWKMSFLCPQKSFGVFLALFISLGPMSSTLAASDGSTGADDKKYFVDIRPAGKPLDQAR
ncbi:hypothetical protein, partial [Nitratifractor sp.]